MLADQYLFCTIAGQFQNFAECFRRSTFSSGLRRRSLRKLVHHR